jgi:chemotaxis protein histidine kinase CheA
MSELADILWQEFATESDEHLVVLEPLLVRLGSPECEPDDVARLFRGFHSLKGLARALSLHGMEATAHRSENLLGLVRDRGVTTTEAMLDVLLEAVDCLKNLRDQVLDSRTDVPAPPPLLQNLDAVFEAAGGPDTKPGKPPPAAAASPEAAPGTEGAAAAGDPAIGQDREMLDLFIELLQTRLPELAAAFDPGATSQDDLIDTLDTLDNAAGVMEFEQTAETFRELKRFLSAQPLPLAAPARRQAAERTAQIVLQARLLSETAGGDTGAEALASVLAGALTEDRASVLAELAAALDALGGAARAARVEDTQHAAAEATATARAAQSLLQSSAAVHAVDLVILIADLCGRMAAGELRPMEPLPSTMRAVTDALAEHTSQGADLEIEPATELTQRIRAALQEVNDPARDGPLHAALAGLQNRPEVLEVLSAENLSDLAAGISAGGHAYELMLFLEDSPALGEAIIGWLTTEAKIISNRTVLTNGQSWFDFLILSPHPPAAVRDALLLRDPERQCVKSLRQVDGETLLDGETAHVEQAVTPAAPGAPKTSGAAADTRTATVLRVRSDVIDRFMTQIGEIRVVAAELSELTTATEGTATQHQSAVAELARSVETNLRRLQAAALELRVVPIDTILNRFPRVVRTLAQEQGKDIHLALEGRDVRVDKSTVELLVDPLMHMVRNAVDHGIEPPDEREQAGKPRQASVTMRAAQRGGEVHVQVSDDGRGLNEAAILKKAVARGLTTEEDAARLKPHEIHRFVFAPGFSTAAKITETSGRGVGMDVVLTTVQQLGGDIDIETRAGQGATFTLRLPISAALQASLLVRVDRQTFGIAERFVASVLEIPAQDYLDLNGQPAIAFKGTVLPVYPLADLLWHDGAERRKRRYRSVVVITNGRETIGVEVDRVRRRQELFLKDLHPLLAACPTVSGAAVLADGRVVLLLDADALIQLVRAGAWRGAREAATGTGP